MFVAGRQGFEPWLTESESVVLPLDDLPKLWPSSTKWFSRCQEKNSPSGRSPILRFVSGKRENSGLPKAGNNNASPFNILLLSTFCLIRQKAYASVLSINLCGHMSTELRATQLQKTGWFCCSGSAACNRTIEDRVRQVKEQESGRRYS
jgi:hypothetical protein